MMRRFICLLLDHVWEPGIGSLDGYDPWANGTSATRPVFAPARRCKECRRVERLTHRRFLETFGIHLEQFHQRNVLSVFDLMKGY